MILKHKGKRYKYNDLYLYLLGIYYLKQGEYFKKRYKWANGDYVCTVSPQCVIFILVKEDCKELKFLIKFLKCEYKIIKRSEYNNMYFQIHILTKPIINFLRRLKRNPKILLGVKTVSKMVMLEALMRKDWDKREFFNFLDKDIADVTADLLRSLGYKAIVIAQNYGLTEIIDYELIYTKKPLII